MRIRVTLEFEVTDESIAEAAEHGVSREDMPQAGADNIKALLGAVVGLVADTATGVEVTE